MDQHLGKARLLGQQLDNSTSIVGAVTYRTKDAATSRASKALSQGPRREDLAASAQTIEAPVLGKRDAPKRGA